MVVKVVDLKPRNNQKITRRQPGTARKAQEAPEAVGPATDNQKQPGDNLEITKK